MKRKHNCRLTSKASLIIRTVLCLCILEACLIAAYVMQSPQFGTILARRVGAMLEHVFASLMIATGGALLLDGTLKNLHRKK